MPMRTINLIQSSNVLIRLFVVLFLLFLIGCDSTGPEESPPAIKILVPELGQEYESYNILYLVAQMDNSQVGSFLVWECSKDSMITWKAISISEAPEKTFRDGDDFSYDVKSWIPEIDTVVNTHIYIKAYDYDINTLFDIKGPFKIN